MIDFGEWLPLWAIGLFPLFWKYSVAMGAIGAALAFAWFSPVLKKTALWIALGIGVGMVCYDTGVRDGESRIRKQWDAAIAASNSQGKQARNDAEHDIELIGRAGSMPNDRYDRDQH